MIPSVRESSSVSIFVDDTEMDNATKTEEFNELQKSINDLSCLKTYVDDNKLSVNVDKCKCMLRGTYQAPRTILDMYIDENLHWDHHIDTPYQKDFIQNWHTLIVEKYSPI